MSFTRTVVWRNLFVFLFSFGFVQSTIAVDDGVYLLKEGDETTGIRLLGGVAGAIDRPLLTSEYELRVFSLTNWNDAFSVFVRHKLPAAVLVPGIAISLGGRLITPVGTMADSLKTLNGEPKAFAVDERIAEKIAALSGAAPILRKHLGQQLMMRCNTKRAVHQKGEPIIINVQIKNIGKDSVFLANEFGGNNIVSTNILFVPDDESAPHWRDVHLQSKKASFISVEPVRPNDIATVREENLLNWFQPRTAGHYTFVVLFTLGVYEDANATSPCWIEQMASSVRVEYQER